MPNNELNFDATPQLVVQFCTMHKGVVKDVKDPMGRLRVRAECPVLLTTGQDNWTQWLENFSNPIGDNLTDGDHGIHWPLQPGQQLQLGFISGDPTALFCIPGPAVQESPDPNTQMLHSEPKAVFKAKGARAATRLFEFKTIAGHTVLMDDNGQGELFMMLDWTGAGSAYVSPGKDQDPQEQDGEESKPRTGKRRGVQTALTGGPKPSELLKDGVQVLGHWDMNGSGYYTVAADQRGMLYLVAGESPDAVDNYVILDTSSKMSLLGAGKTQIWCDDEEGHVYSTSTIIQNQEPLEIEKPLKAIRKAIADRVKEYE